MAVLYELPALAGIYVLIGILFVVAYTFTVLAHVLNVSILGVHPFASVAHAIENVVIDGCNDGIAALEHYAIRLEGFIWDSLQLLFALMILPFAGIGAALAYLWHQLVKPLVADARTYAHSEASRANTFLDTLRGDAATAIDGLNAKIAHYTSAVYQTLTHNYGEAIADATAQTWRGIDVVTKDLRGEFEAGLQGIEGKTDAAIAALDSATAQTIKAVSDAEAATAGELSQLIGQLNPADISAMIAAVPLLAALVQTITSEAGLDSEACRAKVKGICGTNPAGWENLLAGLAPFAFGLSLRELVGVARSGVQEFSGAIREMG